MDTKQLIAALDAAEQVVSADRACALVDADIDALDSAVKAVRAVLASDAAGAPSDVRIPMDIAIDARRMRTLRRLLDAMDDMGNGFPGAVHAAFQDGGESTCRALDEVAVPEDLIRAAPVAPAAVAPTRTYTTKPGESVAGIALRQCGNEAEWRHILSCNPKFADLLPSDYFPVGTVLTMPPSAKGDEPKDTIKKAIETADRILRAGGDYGDELSDAGLRRDLKAARDALRTLIAAEQGGDHA